MTKAEKNFAFEKCKLIQIKLFAADIFVYWGRFEFTFEDVCRNTRNVELKLNDFVFQNAFYRHVCHCSLCAICC